MPAMEKKSSENVVLTISTTRNCDPECWWNFVPIYQNYSSSILACILSNCKHRPSGKNYDFFLDRNPKHYGFILDYLRNNCKIIPSAFPRDVSTLKEIRNEANFLDLDELSSTPEMNGVF